MAKKKIVENKSRVELFIPRGGERMDPNVQIAVNGKTYLLPRGQKSLVPPEVAEEYERSCRAEDAWHNTRAAIKKASKIQEG